MTQAMETVRELAEIYGLPEESVVRAIRTAVSEELKREVVTATVSGDRLRFEAYREDGSVKEIRMSKNIWARIGRRLRKRLDIESVLMSRPEFLRGSVTKILPQGIEVATRYGPAFAPNMLLVPTERCLYVPGATLDFHIHKISVKKGRIILSRTSKKLLLHMLRERLGDIVLDANRKYGRVLKLYLGRELQPEELEYIGALFPKERIKTVVYD